MRSFLFHSAEERMRKDLIGQALFEQLANALAWAEACERGIEPVERIVPHPPFDFDVARDALDAWVEVNR